MSSLVEINCRHDTVNNFFMAVTAGAEHWFLLVSNPVLLLSMTLGMRFSSIILINDVIIAAEMLTIKGWYWCMFANLGSL